MIDVQGTLPNYKTVRKLIQGIKEERFRVGGMFGYLIAGRVSEIVTKVCKSDTGTTPNGPRGQDFDIANYEGNEVLVLNVKTSKRDGLPRDIGVPLDPKLEPFAKPVYDYFQRFHDEEPVFYYTRQDLYNGSKEAFKGYIYPIEPYTIRDIDHEKLDTLLRNVPEEIQQYIKPPKFVVNETKVPRHNRRLALHGSMRHYRTMEMAQRYGFTKEERDIYTGHKTPGSDDRYSHLNWRQYFPKLIK
jgi:hypothetical protein